MSEDQRKPVSTEKAQGTPRQQREMEEWAKKQLANDVVYSQKYIANWYFRFDADFWDDFWMRAQIVMISLFTKTYGRWAILKPIVYKSFVSFLVLNAIWGLPVILPLVFMVNYAIEFFKLVHKARMLSKKEGSKGFLDELSGLFERDIKRIVFNSCKITFKFGCVYSAWAVGTAIGKTFGFLAAGAAFPHLLAGILIVAALVMVAFVIATFITDVLPKLHQARKKGEPIWPAFKAFLPGFSEGAVWSASEWGNVSSVAGMAPDIATVSVSTSFGFGVGGLLDSFFWKFVRRMPRMEDDKKQTLMDEIKKYAKLESVANNDVKKTRKELLEFMMDTLKPANKRQASAYWAMTEKMFKLQLLQNQIAKMKENQPKGEVESDTDEGNDSEVANKVQEHCSYYRQANRWVPFNFKPGKTASLKVLDRAQQASQDQDQLTNIETSITEQLQDCETSYFRAVPAAKA